MKERRLRPEGVTVTPLAYERTLDKLDKRLKRVRAEVGYVPTDAQELRDRFAETGNPDFAQECAKCVTYKL